MLRKSISIAFALFVTTMIQAQEFGLHFMPEIWQANHTNPAFVPSNTFILSFPGASVGAFNTGFAYNEMIRKTDGKNVLSLDPVIKGLKENNYFGANVQLETLTAMFGRDGWRITLGHSIKHRSMVNYSKDMLELGWKGNANFIGQTMEIGPGVESTTYSETKVGFSMNSQKWSIGGRIKFLSGLFNVSTDGDYATVHTEDEFYQMNLQTNYTFNMGGASNYGNIDNFNFDNFKLSSSNLFGPNRGVGIDIGAMYAYTEKLTFSFSLLDLGSIKWKENVYNYSSRGEYEYKGLDFSKIIRDDNVDFDDVTDTLETIFDFKETRNAFTTRLATKLYVGANFEFNKWVSFGSIIYTEQRFGKMVPGAALSVRSHVGNALHGGLTYNYFSGIHSMGANASLQFGPMQVFLVTDNVRGLINPANARSANARFGLNWVFGYGKARAKVRKCESRWMPHTDKM